MSDNKHWPRGGPRAAEWEEEEERRRRGYEDCGGWCDNEIIWGNGNDVEGERERRNERLCGREPRIEMYILLHTYVQVPPPIHPRLFDRIFRDKPIHSCV